MKLREVAGLVPAQREDIADLRTHRALPVAGIDYIDPFLFLNHHGPQEYRRGNSGLPFGPHPHRGFETLTIILEGDILHRDSSGAESVIESGGIQWMRAGSGIVHSEESSPDFKRQGGRLEILQLWINLPGKEKMVAPKYLGLQKEAIPVHQSGGVEVRVLAGNHQGIKGPVETVTHPCILIVTIEPKMEFHFEVPEGQSLFFYIISGEGTVNEKSARGFHTVLFKDEGPEVRVVAKDEMKILICYAAPLGEPVVSYGPFVMNTREEIMQAISDYQNGLFGSPS